MKKVWTLLLTVLLILGLLPVQTTLAASAGDPCPQEKCKGKLKVVDSEKKIFVCDTCGKKCKPCTKEGCTGLLIIKEVKNTEHYWICTACKTETKEAHVMKGTACTLCTFVCGNPHTWDWDTGTGKCKVCGTHHEDHEYTWGNGLCQICGEECEHEWDCEYFQEFPEGFGPDGPIGDPVAVPNPDCRCTKCGMLKDHPYFGGGGDPISECDHEWGYPEGDTTFLICIK